MLLLDTQIALWWLAADARLKRAVRTQMAETPCAISVVSAWEVAIKHRIGELDVAPGVFVNGLRDAEATIFPLIESHAVAVGHMDAGHQNPFDLFLLAVAVNESASLVTADRKFAEYAARHTAVKVVRA